MNVNEDAVVLAAVRERAISGENAERLGYFEWSANVAGPDELTPELGGDPRVWAEANPALGIRISEDQIERERQAMDPTSFAVERCGAGRWPRGDGLPGSVDPQAWLDCWDPEADALNPVTFALDLSPDRTHTAIAAAWEGTDGLPRIDVIEQRSGTAGVPERLAELACEHSSREVVLDAAGPAGSLLPELERLGVKVESVTATQLAQGCGMFFDRVEQRTLRYRRTQALDLAVEAPSSTRWATPAGRRLQDSECEHRPARRSHPGALGQPDKPRLRRAAAGDSHVRDCVNCRNGVGLKPIKVEHRQSGHVSKISPAANVLYRLTLPVGCAGDLSMMQEKGEVGAN